MNEHNPTFRYFLHVPYYTLPSDPIEHDLKSLTKELKNVICHNNLGTEGREIRESTINVMAILSYDERFVKFVKRVQLNFLPNYIGLEETVNNILREIHYKLMDNYLMSVVDAGGSREIAKEAARRFMKLACQIDIKDND